MNAGDSNLTGGTPRPAACAELLETWYRESAGGTFARLDEQEVSLAENLFLRTLAGERSDDLRDSWSRLGCEMREAIREGRRYFVVMERADKRTGRGFFMFADAPDTSVGLFAPHRFGDRLTGEIAFKASIRHAFPVVAWNVVRRSVSDEDNAADLAHIQSTYFTALTRAFANSRPDGIHVQLHGFMPGKRRSGAGEAAGIILSNGCEYPSESLIKTRACLRSRGFTGIRVFPTDIKELGGKTNVSGAILRSMGRPGFVHIEMSWDVRQMLDESPLRLNAFFACLTRELR